MKHLKMTAWENKKFLKPFLVSGYMSFKGLEEMVIITVIFTIHVSIEITSSFLILPIENRFSDDEIIFRTILQNGLNTKGD